MPVLGPIKRRELIRYLRQFGFVGPYAGGNHEFMKRANLKLPLPNPHQGDIGVPLLTRILRKAGITVGESERL